ncbi:TetR/AcrR family transcriptional regulator [Streptomyces sp. NPDC057199]|uniref:TetR/AcrR family transcriptional regulator n=1 Tax=Streptomyces sp. NPDC057199 TaxID=3346047 RepID=UPI00363537B9
MPQTPDTRRTEVLDAVVAHLAEHGMAGLSLRPLAKALGQSTYVLTYHFKDKSGLLAAVLDHLDQQEREALQQWASQASPSSPGAGILAFWHWQIRPEALPLLRLGYEIFGLLSSGRISGHHPRMIDDWIDFIAHQLMAYGWGARAARIDATLISAALSGLTQDYLVTGDIPRIEEALTRLAEYIDAPGPDSE